MNGSVAQRSDIDEARQTPEPQYNCKCLPCVQKIQLTYIMNRIAHSVGKYSCQPLGAFSRRRVGDGRTTDRKRRKPIGIDLLQSPPYSPETRSRTSFVNKDNSSSTARGKLEARIGTGYRGGIACFTYQNAISSHGTVASSWSSSKIRVCRRRCQKARILVRRSQGLIRLRYCEGKFDPEANRFEVRKGCTITTWILHSTLEWGGTILQAHASREASTLNCDPQLFEKPPDIHTRF